jgi:hypothetical protein
MPVENFDGQNIPHENGMLDAVRLVNVVHHAEDSLKLRKESVYGSRSIVFIKDHLLDGFLAEPIWRFRDRVDNLRHDVALRYDYWPTERWMPAFQAVGVRVTDWDQRLGLYPWPTNWVFERSIHFLVHLDAKLPESHVSQ